MTTQNATAGRVTKIALENSDQIQKVEILAALQSGTLTVDPGHEALSYVSTDPGFKGQVPLSWQVTYDDGSTQTVNHALDVKSGPQQAGWGDGGGIYMLETDGKDEVVVETGDTHRKVYVTGSNDAISQSDIEKAEGVSFKNDFLGNKAFAEFLVAHPDYGGSEKMAVDEDVAQVLWQEMTGRDAGPVSHWMLFERGYDYGMERMITRGTEGEDELHPVHVTAWGAGERPVMLDQQMLNQEANRNIVISDIDFADGLQMLSGGNLLLEDIHVTGNQLVVQNTDGLTLRQSEVLDVFYDEPTHSKWGTGADRRQGIYAGKSEGLLVEDSLFDHNGWEDGYDLSRDPDTSQPPSKFSHNVYFQSDTRDVSFRDNVTMRAASTGAQLRGGAYSEDNLFLDNNIAASFGGGEGLGGDTRNGNYSFLNGNVVTSAGHKDGLAIGALSLGVYDYGEMSSLLGNIITHLANPDDPKEIEAKYWSHDALKENASRFFDDTTIYNWDTAYPFNGIKQKNTGDADPASMETTTIQRYTADLLGTDVATIADLADHLRDLTEAGKEIDVDDILNYFREGFGQDLVTGHSQATTVTFVPDELAEGTRWDNRINWDKNSLPINGDIVDLNGSFVQYGGTTDLAELRLGGTSVLALTHGYLGVGTVAGGGRFEIDAAGQIWIDGRSDTGTLEIDLDGGRFANTGRIGGRFEIDAADGELVLATAGGRFDLAEGALSVTGNDAKIGFDGQAGGPAGFDLDGGTLRFVAEDGALGQLTEFRSGAFQTSDVTSLVALDGGRIEVDLADMTGGGTRTLIAVDGLGGIPEELDVTGLGNRNAVLRVDLAEDRVDLVVSTGGSGKSWVEVVDETAGETAAETTLWQKIAGGGVAAPGKAAPEDPDVSDDAPEPVPAPEPDPAPAPTPKPQSFSLDLSAPELEGMAQHAATAGDDLIQGGMAADLMEAGSGNDRVEGGSGDDALFGGSGQDQMTGGGGGDHIAGNDANDQLSGNEGADVLLGGAGQDRLFGNQGDDILAGGPGTDMLVGGAGADQFVFDFADLGQGAVDRIHDFSLAEGDRIVVTGQVANLIHDYDGGDGLSVLSLEVGGEMQDIAQVYDDLTGEVSVLSQTDDYLVLG